VKNSGVPVTAKIRAGWRRNEAVQLARTLEGEGIAGMAVHWRTATEGRMRQEGWKALFEVARAVGVPVIGNGGANTPERAVKFLQESGCAAVMIASGALGNPHIFNQANELLERGEYEKCSWEEKRQSFADYAALAEKCSVATPKRLRAQAIEWVAGFRGVKEIRKRLNAAKTAGEVMAVMDSFAPCQGCKE
jgi:tRNA-dihydrouridine synthase